MAITSIAFSSDAGSELRGWDHPMQQAPQNNNLRPANITLSSSLMDQSAYEGTAYNSTASNFGYIAPSGYGSSILGSQALNTAIRIERSPSFRMLYTRRPADFNHIHKNTQR